MSTHRVGRGSLEPGVPWEAETAYHRRRTRVCHEGSWRFLELKGGGLINLCNLFACLFCLSLVFVIVFCRTCVFGCNVCLTACTFLLDFVYLWKTIRTYGYCLTDCTSFPSYHTFQLPSHTHLQFLLPYSCSLSFILHL